MRAVALVLLLALGVSGWGWYRLYPRVLVLKPVTAAPVCELQEEGVAVARGDAELVASVATFDDELYAYFSFDYLRGRDAVRLAEVFLTRSGTGYPLILHLENDLLTAVPFLEDLRRQGYIPGYEWRWVAPEYLRRLRQQSQFFDSAYTLPVRRTLEGFTPEQVREYVRRFVLFKSRTDPRVRRGVESAPPTLTSEQALLFTDDILRVSDFFWLPLELFLGIGAMENNYMDVTGDLQHAVWKSRAEPGDIVFRRADGRVLVRNHAAGVWQITRETLRYVHRLYLRDEWDYSLLPEHLRPPRQLDLDRVEPGHLTTYAGLLFRDLIDRFQGDVARAVGAYNGGPGNPNMRYESGVRVVANYARRIFEQAGVLDGGTAAETSFLSPAR